MQSTLITKLSAYGVSPINAQTGVRLAANPGPRIYCYCCATAVAITEVSDVGCHALFIISLILTSRFTSGGDVMRVLSSHYAVISVQGHQYTHCPSRARAPKRYKICGHRFVVFL